MMDWELISKQILRHVEDCVTQVPLSSGKRTNAEKPSLATEESSIGDTSPPALDKNGYATGSGSPRTLDALAESLFRNQVTLDNALRIQGDSTDRGLAELREVMRRVVQLERRISEQEDDLVESCMTRSKADGKMTSLQGRQVQLDAKVCEALDTLATLDRRCTAAESAQRGAVDHGQVVDAIRSFFGPFREQVETRLSHLENSISSLKSMLGQASNRELSVEIAARVQKALADEVQRSQANMNQVKGWVKTNADSERERQESVLTALKEQADNLSREVKATDTKCHRAEAGVAELELAVELLGKRLTRGEAGDAARISREMQDTEIHVHRRIEEVRTSCIRRLEEIAVDAAQERDARLKERREVAQEISNVHDALLRSEQHWRGGVHERLNRLEGSLVETVDVNAQTRSYVFSINAQVKQLELEIQSIGDVGRRGKHVYEDKHEAHQLQASLNHPATLPARPPPPALQTSSLRRFSPTMAGESRSEISPVWDEGGESGAVDKAQAFANANHTGKTWIGTSRKALPRVDRRPLEASDVPGQLSFNQSAEAQAKLEDDSVCEEATGKLLPVEKGPLSPSEHERKVVSSVDPKGHSMGDSALPPALTVDDERPTLKNESGILKYLPGNGGNGRPHIAKGSPQCSMDNLRKAVLAAVSESAVEDAAVAVKQSAGSTTVANRHRSPFAAGPASPPPSTPSSSSSFCRSDPSPLSPPHSLSDNGSDTPEASAARTPRYDAVGIPSAATNTGLTRPPAETSSAVPKRDGDNSRAHPAAPAPPSLLATSPKKTTESVERESDSSSFSGEDGEVDGAPVVIPSPRPKPQGQPGESSLARSPRSKNSAGKLGVSQPGSFLPVSESSDVSRCGNIGEGNVAGATIQQHRVTEDKQVSPRKGAISPPLPQSPQSQAVSWGNRKNYAEGCTTGPVPISARQRSASKESGVVTAQCEFCLRRYLKAAMSSHLQVCELRLVRCPFQCGVKVLVRNLEKHKSVCPRKNSTKSEGGADSPASPASSTAVTVNNTSYPNKTDCETGNIAGEIANNVLGGRGKDRTVTCMRCHESLPFHLVPSHGAKCKGKKVGSELPEGASAVTPAVATKNEDLGAKGLENSSKHLSSPILAQTRSATVVGAGSSKEGLSQVSSWSTAGKIPASLPSSGDLGSISKGNPARSTSPLYSSSESARTWHGASRNGAMLTTDTRVPPSPPRSKSVSSWGVRQVTSWLREVMRPPRADIISRFHDRGVVGTMLLGLTDRYLVHPTEGMGIKDEGIRRQILEAVDSLKE